ncbi:MAG: thioredoxin family protein [bacterium]
MPFLDEKVQGEVREQLAELEEEVSLLLFTREEDCQFCDETAQLLREVADLSAKVNLEVRDLEESMEVAEHYQVDKVPALVVQGEQDHGIRFYGIPSGYEFGSLLEIIRLVSKDDPELGEEQRGKLASLEHPVHLQVFVTPTCPYCPRAVVAAQKMAMASEWVRADMVEASEFPELTQHYQVQGVPRTIMNEEHHIEGAVPEEHLLEWVLSEAGSSGE